ncbi:hypothetical protein GW17_00004655 [Ensete ventricosum]|nr:hypothetical protein GW17_00004655 [Ensete ventricosum]
MSTRYTGDPQLSMLDFGKVMWSSSSTRNPLEPIQRYIIDIMEDQIGKPLEVLIKRADNTSLTLTIVPEEAKTDILTRRKEC